MKEGTISLYDYDHSFLASGRYECLSDRNRLIEKWRQKYGKKLERMYFVIAPYHFIGKVKPRN